MLERRALMSIKVKLTEDQVLIIRADPEQWSRAYRHALESDSVIEVHGAEGRTLAINPRQILFWEEVPDEGDQAEQDQGSSDRTAQTV
jgi:hypothetical protein